MSPGLEGSVEGPGVVPGSELGVSVGPGVLGLVEEEATVWPGSTERSASSHCQPSGRLAVDGSESAESS